MTGTVTLDAQGVSSAVFIFQIGSTLTTASASSVNLINGAQACNVFWQVGSSATLGTTTAFRGSIMALTSISLSTGATIVEGRALARNGAVTLDTNTITRDTCATPMPTPTPEPTASVSPAPVASSPTPGLPDTSVRNQIVSWSGTGTLVVAGLVFLSVVSLIAARRRQIS